MAFFGNYTEDNNVTLENSAKYENELGLGVIALECAQFDSELFTECVKSDIQEYQVVQEGGDLEAFQEGAWETIKTKVVAFYRKIKEKVKAFFRGWYAKIAARIVSDNKAFYNKYKKVVDEKDLSGLEVKWFASKKSNDFADDDSDKIPEFDEVVAKLKDDAEAEDVIEICYEALGVKNITSHSEFKREVQSEFDDAIEDDVKYTTVSADIEGCLKDGNGVLKKVENAYNKAYAKMDKEEKKLVKTNKDIKNIGIIAHNTVKCKVTCLEVLVSFIKQTLKMARIAYAKAVAYKPKMEASLLAVEADAIEFLG